MAKNLVNGTNVVVEQSGNNINMNLSNDILNTLNSAKGVILYNNTSGTKTNFQLSQSVSDFSYIEVHFGRDTWAQPTKSIKVKRWNSQDVDFGFFMDMLVGSAGNGYLSILTSYATIKDTQVTFDTARNTSKEIPGTSITYSANSGQVSIFQIIGYK